MKTRIAEWMQDAIKSRRSGLERDLHLDELDVGQPGRHDWMRLGCEALLVAAGMRDQFAAADSVALGMSLRCASGDSCSRTKSLGEVFRLADHTPPSLFFFRRGTEPWFTEKEFSPWTGSLSNELGTGFRGWCARWWDVHDEEPRESFFVSSASRSAAE